MASKITAKYKKKKSRSVAGEKMNRSQLSESKQSFKKQVEEKKEVQEQNYVEQMNNYEKQQEELKQQQQLQEIEAVTLIQRFFRSNQQTLNQNKQKIQTQQVQNQPYQIQEQSQQHLNIHSEQWHSAASLIQTTYRLYKQSHKWENLKRKFQVDSEIFQDQEIIVIEGNPEELKEIGKKITKKEKSVEQIEEEGQNIVVQNFLRISQAARVIQKHAKKWRENNLTKKKENPRILQDDQINDSEAPKKIEFQKENSFTQLQDAMQNNEDFNTSQILEQELDNWAKEQAIKHQAAQLIQQNFKIFKSKNQKRSQKDKIKFNNQKIVHTVVILQRKFREKQKGLELIQNLDLKELPEFIIKCNQNRPQLLQTLIPYQNYFVPSSTQFVTPYIQYKDGTICQGTFRFFQLHGYGRKFFTNRSYFEGNFEKNCVKGKGVYVFQDKIIAGDWSENQANGEMVILYKNQDKYTGTIDNTNKFNGKGRLVKLQQFIYEGEFLAGSISGKGKIQWVDGNQYEGEFQADQLNGYGKFLKTNGQVYIGGYINGKKHGYGELQWPDGKQFKGNFVAGQVEGKGVLINKNGQEQECLWEKNQIVKKISKI